LKGIQLEKGKDHNPESEKASQGNAICYVLIRGPFYGSLDFEAREDIRTSIREKLEAQGIRFLEYPWVWDEEGRCLLLVGRYEKKEDAFWWIQALETMGFEICIRTSLPGDEQGEDPDGKYYKSTEGLMSN
jgi:hypothetical protein